MSNRRNARVSKTLSLLYVGLVVAALLLVHRPSYEPGVSFVLFYLVAAILVTAAVALLFLPVDQFTGGFCAAVYVFWAIFVAMAVFFSGGVSSELHALYWPLIFASALHGSLRVWIAAMISTLVGYALAVLPAILGQTVDTEDPIQILFRLGAFSLTGVFVMFAARSVSGSEPSDEAYAVDEDGSMMLEMAGEALKAGSEGPAAVLLVDPGKVEDLDLLLERVRDRIGEPVLLGEGSVFGMILPGLDDAGVEGAARRVIATASSLGSDGTRVGAAIYPRDARSPEELLTAAGQALEAAFEAESPSAIAFAGGSAPHGNPRGKGGSRANPRAGRRGRP